MEKSFRDNVKEAFTPKYSLNKKNSLILGILSLIVLLAVWQIISTSGLVKEAFMPTPLKTLQSGAELFKEDDFIFDIGITVFRVMTGFIIASMIALPIGVLIGIYGPISSFFEPVLSFLRYLPASAFIPLFILWIGIGENEKIAIIILGSVCQLILMIAQDTKNVDNSLIEVSYTLGTSKANVLWKVILKRAMPDIVDTLRIVLGWAWTYVIVAEMVGASAGIGYMIIQSQRMLNTSKIFMGIFSIGCIGLLVDIMLKWINKKMFSWNFK